MSVEIVFSPSPMQERDPRLARQFERVVLEALRSKEVSPADGTVHVRFHLWEGDDVPRYVCKVECAGVASVHLEEPPWRWWSGLVETPQELGQALRAAVRGRRRRAAPTPCPAVPAGEWASDLQPV
jgi:hypothetical protein